MIDITFDEIGEHIERGDIKEWLAELRVLNATKGMLADDRKTEPTSSKMEQVEDEPQTDCNGCKFVGTYDTEFPCANCSRKTKDYYAKDEPQPEREGE